MFLYSTEKQISRNIALKYSLHYTSFINPILIFYTEFYHAILCIKSAHKTACIIGWFADFIDTYLNYFY